MFNLMFFYIFLDESHLYEMGIIWALWFVLICTVSCMRPSLLWVFVFLGKWSWNLNLYSMEGSIFIFSIDSLWSWGLFLFLLIVVWKRENKLFKEILQFIILIGFCQFSWFWITCVERRLLFRSSGGGMLFNAISVFISLSRKKRRK